MNYDEMCIPTNCGQIIKILFKMSAFFHAVANTLIITTQQLNNLSKYGAIH